jgi:hypothetical protein
MVLQTCALCTRTSLQLYVSHGHLPKAFTHFLTAQEWRLRERVGANALTLVVKVFTPLCIDDTSEFKVVLRNTGAP